MGNMKQFDALQVPMEGSNLIEASAGTGKTYSIAVLALRMIIEKGLTVKQILMVTFTNAAVAELELRIRLFVRQAYGYACHRDDRVDVSIKKVVDGTGQTDRPDKETVRERLATAVRDLDDTQIMTIHGFCQQTLLEFAFETEQAFDAEVLSDQTLLNERVCNRFWREEVSVLDPVLLKLLLYKKGKFPFKKSILTLFVDKVLSGKKLITAPLEGPGDFSTVVLEDKHAMPGKMSGMEVTGKELSDPEVLEEIRLSLKKTEEAYRLFCQKAESQFPGMRTQDQTNAHARKLLEQSATAQDFIDLFEARWVKKYLVACFPDIAELYEPYYKQQQEMLRFRTSLVEHLLMKLQAVAEERMREVKGRKNVVGFDDLINSLSKAVEKESVCRLLRDKYAAVFIDEFQDTDREQYKIFHDVFSSPAVQEMHDHVVFYIGDPKQSIFGWRKADLNTYKTARGQVKSIYTMNSNFRSTSRLIDALNSFFSLENAFLDPEILYFPVRAGTKRAEMTEKGTQSVPISICNYDIVENIPDMVCSKVVEILSSDSYALPSRDGGREQIRPSDIGIIVRTNKQAKIIRNELAHRNVPAVTLDDTRVLSSPQARQLHNVLLAIRNSGRVSLGRALLNPYFGFDTEAVISMDEEKELERFREMHAIWSEWGIYNALSAFLKIYRVRDHCTAEGNLQGQRAITNYLHIMELLHKAEIRSSLSPDELISWLSRQITGDNKVEDEYQQRIESDENAVQITTIHKCKGLTYKIVFAPYLNTIWKEREFIDFQLPYPRQEYVMAVNKTDEFVQMAKNQFVQEHRRLIYVTLTRAVYKCYVYTKDTSCSLQPFMVALGGGIKGLIEPLGHSDEKIPHTWAGGRKKSVVEKAVSRDPNDVPPMEGAWGVRSFSSLVGEMPFVLPVQEPVSPGLLQAGSTDVRSAYDDFIFDRLPRGAKTGVFIHHLFQHIVFDDSTGWPDAVDRAMRMFPHCCAVEDREHLLTMINHVLHVRIGEDLVLAQVNDREKAGEMAFFYNLQAEGLMMGFMDLFFRFRDKYYILDWKSNYMGSTPEDYNQTAVDNVVRESRYDLQYNIYTMAALRYLSSKISGFDASRDFGGVVYLFVRGIREGFSHGVYLKKGAQVLGQPFFSEDFPSNLMRP
ncbi:MAG TPA: UvrD-helicase domain-containing protein [Bacteroidales bacterium]|nr:UvrD-helicase domain-containing protein [Bacteroidales bacterium]